MLDKQSKMLIKFLKTCDEFQFYYCDDLPKSLDALGDEASVSACIRYLVSQGYIEYILTTDNQHVGIALSHTGIHKSEFARLTIKSFFLHNIIAFIALGISIAAFIKSFF